MIEKYRVIYETKDGQFTQDVKANTEGQAASKVENCISSNVWSQNFIQGDSCGKNISFCYERRSSG